MSLPRSLKFAALSPLILITACATVPTGTSVMALPGTGKSFDQFRADDAECKSFAYGQVGGSSAQQASVDSAVTSAAVGTAVGALAGAAVCGSSGAGVGAASGLIIGSVAGTGASQYSAYGVQQRFDNAYVQCMYARGERVPVSGQIGSGYARPHYYAPARYYAPPPPQGYVESPPQSYAPPPPPPGYAPPAPPR